MVLQPLLVDHLPLVILLLRLKNLVDLFCILKTEKRSLDPNLPMPTGSPTDTATQADPDSAVKLQTQTVLQPADEKLGLGGFQRTINQLAYGANEYILALPDMVINAFLDAKGLATGDPVENKNLLTRLFNSGDYETVRTIIPGVLNLGLGQKVGPQGAIQ